MDLGGLVGELKTNKIVINFHKVLFIRILWFLEMSITASSLYLDLNKVRIFGRFFLLVYAFF